MAEKIIYTMKDLDSPPKSKEDWKGVCTRERLSESFIREHANDVYWPCVSIYQAKWISIDFAIKSGEIIWYPFLQSRKQAGLMISEKELENCSAAGVFRENSTPFLIHCAIPVSFLRQHKEEVTDWDSAFLYQCFSEDEIEEFVDKMTSKCWDTVCWRQSLSEDFMNRHYKNLNWEYVSQFQVFSASFLSRFKCRLDLEVLSKRTDLPFLVRC